MILEKLQEALAEVGTQRKALDDVEEQLRTMIARLSGVPNVQEEIESFDITSEQPRRRTVRRKIRQDKLEDFVNILRFVGHPLHIKELAGRYSSHVGRKVLRTEIEPGINRHISKTKVPRIAKFAPSTYGLPEWRQTPALAHAS